MTQEEMLHIFKKQMPGSLFLTHYELALNFGGRAEDWKRLLKDNKSLIDQETSFIAEINARKALKRLPEASGQEVTALVKMIENSKLLQQKHQEKQSIIFHHIGHAPQKAQEDDTAAKPQSLDLTTIKEYLAPIDDYVLTHCGPVSHLYEDYRNQAIRIMKGEVR